MGWNEIDNMKQVRRMGGVGWGGLNGGKRAVGGWGLGVGLNFGAVGVKV